MHVVGCWTFFFTFTSTRIKLDCPLQKRKLTALTGPQHLICQPAPRLEEIVDPTLQISKLPKHLEVIHVSHHHHSRHKVDNMYTGCKRADTFCGTTFCQILGASRRPCMLFCNSQKKHLMSLSSGSSMTTLIQERFAEV